MYTDKKGNQIFLINKEIQNGAVAKSYMRQGFLIYEEMRKYFSIYEEAVSHIWLCNCSILNFLIFEENFIFFFISVRSLKPVPDGLNHLPRSGSDLILNENKKTPSEARHARKACRVTLVDPCRKPFFNVALWFLVLGYWYFYMTRTYNENKILRLLRPLRMLYESLIFKQFYCIIVWRGEKVRFCVVMLAPPPPCNITRQIGLHCRQISCIIFTVAHLTYSHGIIN